MERRSFLSGLASLPMIGGSVALIGRPTAAAVPASPELQRRYLAWLANEHAAILAEVNPIRWALPRLEPTTWREKRVHSPMFWFPDAPDIEAHITAAPASTRAAVVLSAAGTPLFAQGERDA